MKALKEDAEAMAIGMFVSIGVSLLFCIASVALISWSALRQVTRQRIYEFQMRPKTQIYIYIFCHIENITDRKK